MTFLLPPGIKGLKEKSVESKKAYNKQCNNCVSMVKKAKKEYFQNINLSEITDNKKFWKTISPLYSNKVKNNQKINLIEKNVLVTSEVEIAKTFKEYSDQIAPKLNIIENECYIRKIGKRGKRGSSKKASDGDIPVKLIKMFCNTGRIAVLFKNFS